MFVLLTFLFLCFCVFAIAMVLFEGLEALDITSGVYTAVDKAAGRIPTGYDVGDKIPYNSYNAEYPPFKKSEQQRNLLYQLTVIIILTAIFLNTSV